MRWLERHSWWGLLGMAVLFGLFGVTDIAGGAEADALIPLSLTGMTLEELQAEGAASYRLFDFFSRINGWTLILSGALMTAILLFASAATSAGRGGRCGSCRSGRSASQSSTSWRAPIRRSPHRRRWCLAPSSV